LDKFFKNSVLLTIIYIDLLSKNYPVFLLFNAWYAGMLGIPVFRYSGIPGIPGTFQGTFSLQIKIEFGIDPKSKFRKLKIRKKSKKNEKMLKKCFPMI